MPRINSVSVSEVLSREHVPYSDLRDCLRNRTCLIELSLEDTYKLLNCMMWFEYATILLKKITLTDLTILLKRCHSDSNFNRIVSTISLPFQWVADNIQYLHWKCLSESQSYTMEQWKYLANSMLWYLTSFNSGSFIGINLITDELLSLQHVKMSKHTLVNCGKTSSVYFIKNSYEYNSNRFTNYLINKFPRSYAKHNFEQLYCKDMYNVNEIIKLQAVLHIIFIAVGNIWCLNTNIFINIIVT